MLDLLPNIEVGCALTVPSRLWLDEDSGEERAAVTLCKARRGARHRIGRKVQVDCPVSLVRGRAGENEIPVIVRAIRMGDRDYFVEFINRYPLPQGGHLTIRPQGGGWTITHPTRGVVGRSEGRDLALVIAQVWVEAL